MTSQNLSPDGKNLNLLALCHSALGMVGLMFASIAIFLAWNIMPKRELFGGSISYVFFKLLYIWVLLLALTVPVLMIAAASKLRRRTGRTFCPVVAVIECTFFPFGTVLGFFTIIMLMKVSVRPLFGNT